MIYFGEEILPKIRWQVPEASFTIVGRNPTQKLRDAAETTRHDRHGHR